ncbi:hypothetical protein NA63_1664 [Flavobacteriaceae bacterium MAR_2010_105]|nr:hypothetical protein NA63_1664 [Flavobacteriaceae bacterium MAR_2010_105]
MFNILYHCFAMHRLCIYTQDVIFITGKSESYARELMRDLRLLHRKDRHQLVAISEFCDYVGLPYRQVFNMINRIRDDTSL